jgi:hypothetical protein
VPKPAVPSAKPAPPVKATKPPKAVDEGFWSRFAIYDWFVNRKSVLGSFD